MDKILLMCFLLLSPANSWGQENFLHLLEKQDKLSFFYKKFAECKGVYDGIREGRSSGHYMNACEYCGKAESAKMTAQVLASHIYNLANNIYKKPDLNWDHPYSGESPLYEQLINKIGEWHRKSVKTLVAAGNDDNAFIKEMIAECATPELTEVKIRVLKSFKDIGKQ